MLLICLGTDMIPDIALAYETPELDIMLRQPRNIKLDHLVSAKLLSFSYIQMGTIQTIAGFYTFFIVLNDYGFKPSILWNIGNRLGTEPKFGDIYNPLAGPCKGNSNCGLGMPMR